MKRIIHFLLSVVLFISSDSFGCDKHYSKGSGKQLVRIRDSEIENFLKAIIGPLSEAAGLESKDIKLIVMMDPTFNAYASIDYRMTVQTGLITEAKDLGALVSVIGHEMAHLACGHIMQGIESHGRAANILIAGMASSILLESISRAINKNDDSIVDTNNTAKASSAMMALSQRLALQEVFQFTQNLEREADIYSINYFKKLKWPMEGVIKTHKIMGDMERSYEEVMQPIYFRTHPPSRERRALVEQRIGDINTYKGFRYPEGWEDRYKMVCAKINAFQLSTTQVTNKYGHLEDITSKYAMAILYYRNKDFGAALKRVDDLIKLEPKNVYFHELKANILIEDNKVNEAIEAYEQAIRLDKNHTDVLNVSYSKALLIRGGKEDIKKAEILLNKLKVRNNDLLEVWQGLANIYDLTGRAGLKFYALAEIDLLTGNYKRAVTYVENALKILKKGDNGYHRAQDLRDHLKRIRSL